MCKIVECFNSPLREGRGIKRHKKKKNNNSRGREIVRGFVRRMTLIRQGGVHGGRINNFTAVDSLDEMQVKNKGQSFTGRTRWTNPPVFQMTAATTRTRLHP